MLVRVLALASLGALLVIACAGTTSFKVDVTAAGQEGHAEFRHDSAGHKVKITNSTGEAMDVSFRDADGNQVGTTSRGVASGSSINVPAGATEVVVSTPATPPPPSSGSGGMAETEDDAAVAARPCILERVVANPRRPYRIRVAPLEPVVDRAVPLANVSFDCNVLAPASGWDAHRDGWSLIGPILLAGPGTPIPNEVEIVSFVRVQREKLGARILAGDIGHFTDFRLTWNGTFGYADLAAGHGVTRYAPGNGWEVCETFVPIADFDVPTHPNGGALTLANTSDPQPQLVEMAVRFFH